MNLYLRFYRIIQKWNKMYCFLELNSILIKIIRRKLKRIKEGIG